MNQRHYYTLVHHEDLFESWFNDLESAEEELKLRPNLKLLDLIEASPTIQAVAKAAVEWNNTKDVRSTQKERTAKYISFLQAIENVTADDLTKLGINQVE